MVTGALFEPKALCGSTSGRPAADCGAGGSGAAFAATTGTAMTGVSEGADALAVSEGVCANAGTDGKAGAGDWCKEGRNKANKLSKPTLRIPARRRRRFTRSSEMLRAICPCGTRNRILPRNRGNVRVVVARTSPKHQGDAPPLGLSLVGCRGEWKRCAPVFPV